MIKTSPLAVALRQDQTEHHGAPLHPMTHGDQDGTVAEAHPSIDDRLDRAPAELLEVQGALLQPVVMHLSAKNSAFSSLSWSRV